MGVTAIFVPLYSTYHATYLQSTQGVIAES